MGADSKRPFHTRVKQHGNHCCITTNRSMQIVQRAKTLAHEAPHTHAPLRRGAFLFHGSFFSLHSFSSSGWSRARSFNVSGSLLSANAFISQNFARSKSPATVSTHA